MPQLLLDRCQPNSIREFRAAALQRARDAQTLVAGERRTAGIYLWGYAAEMMLKASYFAVIGFADGQQITIPDLHAARLSATRLGVVRFANLHDVRGWAELLVATRAALPGYAYAVPGFGNRVVAAGARVYTFWREALRYHKNVAYEFEVTQVQTASQWLLTNSSVL